MLFNRCALLGCKLRILIIDYSTIVGREWLPIREYKRMHVSINPVIFDMLKDCSQRSGYTMNTLVNTALHDYLNELDQCLKDRGK